jgi:sec-independent protein translocase protein TatB
MNVFGVGPAELIVILVVALIFVGPERLPRLAADIARTIRDIRRYTGSIAAEFSEVLEEFDRETADDRSQWKEIGQGLTDATKSVTEALRGAQADAAGAPAAPAQSASTNGTPAAAANGRVTGAADDGAAWVAIPEPPADGAQEPEPSAAEQR